MLFCGIIYVQKGGQQVEEKIKKAKRVVSELIGLALEIGTLVAIIKVFILDVLLR